MKNDRGQLKSTHEKFSEALKAFVSTVLSAQHDREPTDLKGLSITISADGKKTTIRHGGLCGIYEDPLGVCRPCTAEKTHGEIIPG